MRRGWAGRAAAVVLPLAFGVPLMADGAMAVYSGYSSMWWPSTRATVTRFRADPVLPDEDDADANGRHEAEGEADGEEKKEGMERDITAIKSRVQRSIDKIRYSKYTLDFTVEFEYTLPDGKRYVGTSKKDANFPSRLDIGCPSCMKQAEAIIGFFGQPNKEFLLFYEPRPSKLLGSRKEKDSQTVEGRYPSYCLDAGMVAPISYERLAWGSTLVGASLLNLSPSYRAQSLLERLRTHRGMLPVLGIAVASGLSVYGLSRLIEAKLSRADVERRS